MASPRLRSVLARLEREVKNWEKQSDRSGMRTGVDSRHCAALCQAMGKPQRRMRCVHIAGSKGKGSVAALIAAGLASVGKKVGLLSSPHLTHITERVRLGPHLQPIDDEKLALALETGLSKAKPGTSWFDLMIASSLQALNTAKCQWAVVECGLGGRLDSTNVLKAKLCALTSVELEHTEVLGNTVSAIAREKAAIASDRGWLFLSRSAVPHAARRTAARTARSRGARIVLTPDLRLPTSSFTPSNLGLAYKILSFILGSKKKSLRLLKSRRVLATARRALPGRQQWLHDHLLLDAAHTPDSVRALSYALRGRSVIALLSLAPDKDVERFVEAIKTHLMPLNCVVLPLQPNDQRALDQAVSLQGALRAAGLSVILKHDLEAGLRAAESLATSHGSTQKQSATVTIFGSFVLAGQVVTLFEKLAKKRERIMRS